VGLCDGKWAIALKERHIGIAALVYWQQRRRVGDRYVGDGKRKTRRAELSNRGISSVVVGLTVG
jgi:hypothetical protein